MLKTQKGLWLLALGMLLATACGAREKDLQSTNAKSANPPVELGGARPARVILPAGYSPAKRYPLIVLLHGYSANSLAQDLIFGLRNRIDREPFVLVLPEGTKDDDGNRFWNATPECCNFDGSSVDDVAYLGGLIDEAVATYSIAPGRVAFVGHSNGGYMSYRMACEMPEKVRRIVVLAGAVFLEESSCKGSLPVSSLHIHGTDDGTIPFEPFLGTAAKGEFRMRTVGAEASIERWSKKANCAARKAQPVQADYVSIAGAETDVFMFTGCQEDIDIEFWRVNEGDHVFLDVNDAFRDAVLAFLLDSAR